METNVQGQDVSPNDAKRVLPAVPIDGDGQVLHEGDRVIEFIPMVTMIIGSHNVFMEHFIKTKITRMFLNGILLMMMVKNVPFWKCCLSLRHSR